MVRDWEHIITSMSSEQVSRDTSSRYSIFTHLSQTQLNKRLSTYTNKYVQREINDRPVQNKLILN